MRVQPDITSIVEGLGAAESEDTGGSTAEPVVLIDGLDVIMVLEDDLVALLDLCADSLNDAGELTVSPGPLVVDLDFDATGGGAVVGSIEYGAGSTATDSKLLDCADDLLSYGVRAEVLDALPEGRFTIRIENFGSELDR